MKRTYNTAKEGGTRRKGVESRIISFINKIREIDYKYLPKPSLRKTDSAAHSKALSVWRKKVQDACANEKKYLAAEEKIQISSYKKLMTRYRNDLKNMKFLHPKFEIQLDALKVRYRSKADYIEVYRTDVVSLRSMLKEAKSLLSTELRDKPNERWAYAQVSRLDYEHPALRYMRLNSDQMAIFKQDGVTNLAAIQKKANAFMDALAFSNLWIGAAAAACLWQSGLLLDRQSKQSMFLPVCCKSLCCIKRVPQLAFSAQQK